MPSWYWAAEARRENAREDRARALAGHWATRSGRALLQRWASWDWVRWGRVALRHLREERPTLPEGADARDHAQWLVACGWELLPLDEHGRRMQQARDVDWRACYAVDECDMEAEEADHLLSERRRVLERGECRGGAPRRARGRGRGGRAAESPEEPRGGGRGGGPARSRSRAAEASSRAQEGEASAAELGERVEPRDWRRARRARPSARGGATRVQGRAEPLDEGTRIWLRREAERGAGGDALMVQAALPFEVRAGPSAMPPPRWHGPVCPPCLLYTSPSPRDATLSRMPSSA